MNSLPLQALNFLLFETASGYSLFEVKEIDSVGLSMEQIQESISNMERFSKIVTLSAFKPFSKALEALEQINAVSESQMTDMLKGFLETKLASSILEATGEP